MVGQLADNLDDLAGRNFGTTEVRRRLLHRVQELGVRRESLDLRGETRSGVSSLSAIITAAPAATSTEALRVWWSSAANGNGMRMDARWQTVISARVLAPARQMSRLASW